MTPQLLIFFIVAFKLIAASLCVIFARNPIYSVLFLIAAFLNTSVVFLLAGAEFLALILAIVYVGAVAILFLFVVMMFDVAFDSIKERVRSFGLLALGLCLFFLTELGAVIWVWKSYSKAKDIIGHAISQKVSNTAALGHILYTDFFFAFQLAGIVLLVAMIGAIVLTLKTEKTLKRQSHQRQMERSPENTLKLVKVKSNQGLVQ
ncbi:MAG: NADH-quinone oxidoreductase subunit J [Alphaproteobacteria bacterium]|nr:NADH-quinone oxidoreductase subunit J [Alphaproteobacteria bacterium]